MDSKTHKVQHSLKREFLHRLKSEHTTLPKGYTNKGGSYQYKEHELGSVSSFWKVNHVLFNEVILVKGGKVTRQEWTAALVKRHCLKCDQHFDGDGIQYRRLAGGLTSAYCQACVDVATNNKEKKMTPAKRKVSTEDVKEAPKQTTGLEEALGLLIHDNVGDRVKEEMDARGITEDAVQKIVMEVISKKALPQFTKRVKPKKGEPEFDLVHMRYADAKFWLDMNQSVYLNGPSGSGKTVAAQQLAQSYDNPCLIHSCHGEMTVYDLCGYMDGNGKYNPTPFYNAWKAGHIILIDEVDKAPGEVNVFLNAATAQGIITFPNGEILKKKDTCHIILTGNTKMAGADATYSTGQRQDASFSNRLVAIDWPYDKHLETMLANQEVKAYGGKPEQATEVVEKISQIRKAVATLGMSYVVGQRQTMMVSAGVATGRSQTKVYQEIVYGWMDDNDVKRIRSEVKKNA